VVNFIPVKGVIRKGKGDTEGKLEMDAGDKLLLGVCG